MVGSGLDPLAALAFVVADADDATRAEVEDSVRSDPAVSSVRVVTQAEAYEEFQSLYAEVPEMLQAVSPGILPASIRVALDLDGGVDAAAWADTGRDAPRVFQVVIASDTFPPGQRLGDGLLRPLVAASTGDVVPFVGPGPLVQEAIATAPDELVADLETLAGAVDAGSVEVTPEITEAAGRLLDHAESVCGFDAS